MRLAVPIRVACGAYYETVVIVVILDPRAVGSESESVSPPNSHWSTRKIKAIVVLAELSSTAYLDYIHSHTSWRVGVPVCSSCIAF